MPKTQTDRAFLTALAVATLISIFASYQGTRLRPIVAVETPETRIALSYPTPEYPLAALSLHITGDVTVTVRIDHGDVIAVGATSRSSILAESARRWVAGEWRFKPSVSGVFTIPISYRESS